MKVVCLGDSITYGQYLPKGESPWPNRLIGYEVYNHGVNSDTTRLGLERFPEVQQLAPTAVVIQFGHNDCNHWESDRGLPRVSPRAYSANLEEMIERARAFEIIPFLCLLTPSFRSPRHAGDVAIYTAILREVGDVTKTQVIDTRSGFTEEHLLGDGLHLNADGHRLYAARVQDYLDAVLQ